jgi:predicted nucleotidyltransferase
LDAITELAGVGFAEAWQRREIMQIQDVPVPFIALTDLIATKAAAGREKDLADLDILRKIASG